MADMDLPESDHMVQESEVTVPELVLELEVTVPELDMAVDPMVLELDMAVEPTVQEVTHHTEVDLTARESVLELDHMDQEVMVPEVTAQESGQEVTHLREPLAAMVQESAVLDIALTRHIIQNMTMQLIKHS